MSKEVNNGVLLKTDFCCDRCKLLSFVEVYGKESWWYECLPHFILKESWKKGWCITDWLYRLPLIKQFWDWWAKQ